MTAEPTWSKGPPRTILLATDFSGRCDRAMDRAVQLAKLWRAKLVVLTVVEPKPQGSARSPSLEPHTWRRTAGEDPSASVRIRREFGDVIRDADLHIEEGGVVPLIDTVASDVGAELIVTGISRDETLGSHVLGSTVERLACETPIPLLIVKRRVQYYGEILVATDFSESSQHALTAADRFFPSAPITVLHAWQSPATRILDGGNFRKQWRNHEQSACESFLRESQLTWEARARLKVLVEQGRPEILVRDYMLDRDVDLVVVGTHGQGGPLDKQLGGTAKRILHTAPGDVLLIRDPHAVRRTQLAGSERGDAPTP